MKAGLFRLPSYCPLPVACIGAFLSILVLGMENNVYFQIGLVMLIGVAAKNAILIVEFAQGKKSRKAKTL